MLSENKTTEHQRSSSGRIDTAIFQKKHRGHLASMMFLTMALALGAAGLLLYASMENNRSSLSKIDELERNNIALTRESTIPISQPQEIVQQMQDSIPNGHNINAQLPVDIIPENETVNLDTETLPPAEEFFD